MEGFEFFGREKWHPRSCWTRIPNYYNGYFTTVGYDIQIELNINQNFKNEKTYDFEPFKFENETVENIEKIIDKIKTDVATGIDGIPSKIIKQAKTVISPYLTKIINVSFETKIFPDILKKVIIKPIHKKDDKNDISNYRPISILPVISKIFVRATLNQLLTFFENNFL